MPTNGANGKERTRIKSDNQVLPLIVSAARSRVREPILMSAATSRDLRRYVKWAAGQTRMSSDEVMVLTLDKAIGDLLKRDEAWQQARKQETESRSEDATGPNPIQVGPTAPQPPSRQP